MRIIAPEQAVNMGRVGSYLARNALSTLNHAKASDTKAHLLSIYFLTPTSATLGHFTSLYDSSHHDHIRFLNLLSPLLGLRVLTKSCWKDPQLEAGCHWEVLGSNLHSVHSTLHTRYDSRAQAM